MPERFQAKVSREVARQCRRRKNIRAPRSVRRAVVVVCVAAGLCGATVFAAAEFKLGPFLEQANEEAPALIETEVQAAYVPDPTQPPAITESQEEHAAADTTEPLITIDETLYDGNVLHIYATKSAAGMQYDLNTDGVGIIVDGNDVSGGNAHTLDIQQSGDQYYLKIDMADVRAEGAFEVVLPLSVYAQSDVEVFAAGEEADLPERFENQEVRFTVEGKAEAVAAQPQTIECEGYTVELAEFEAAPASTILRYTVYFDSGQEAADFPEAAPYVEIGSGGDILNSGLNDDILGGSSIGGPYEQDGKYAVDITHSLRAFQAPVKNTVNVKPFRFVGDDMKYYPEYEFEILLGE